jgi:branched-subunit amino acid ABC-type transport system permease component
LSIILAIGFSAGLGGLLYALLYRPLRRGGATELILLLASLGAYVVLQNAVSLMFGDQIISLNEGRVTQSFTLGGAVLNSVQIAAIIVAASVVLATLVFLRRTTVGRAIRAVSSNEQLANLCGIDSERIALVTFIIGSGLAGIAGILNGLDVDLAPTMGLTPLMMGIVAVVVGGRGRVVGIALGALLIGVSQNVGIWRIDARWQNAIAFVILLAFLLWRPSGLAGAHRQVVRVDR